MIVAVPGRHGRAREIPRFWAFCRVPCRCAIRAGGVKHPYFCGVQFAAQQLDSLALQPHAERVLWIGEVALLPNLLHGAGHTVPDSQGQALVLWLRLWAVFLAPVVVTQA
jgi:hypothetical protein